jgi:hypothetical protein
MAGAGSDGGSNMKEIKPRQGSQVLRLICIIILHNINQKMVSKVPI